MGVNPARFALKIPPPWQRPERPALVWRGDMLLAFDIEQVRRHTVEHPLTHDR